MSIYEQLANVQQSLRAPKDQRNNFGNYNYRSCESILEAVKPLLAANGLALTLTDEMISVGDRIYVKATAKVTQTNGDGSLFVSAFAREEESKKGMDASQVTGAASSYARKYALNGLFCIDDNKDSDATNTHGKDAPKKGTQKAEEPESVETQADKLLQDEDGVKFAVCAQCGGYIYDWKQKNGNVMSVRDFVINSLIEYGKPLCRSCIKAAKSK